MNRVQKVVNKLLPYYGNSIPQLSSAMGIHRSTLHHAMARGRFSTELQEGFVKIAEEKEILIEAGELLNV